MVLNAKITDPKYLWVFLLTLVVYCVHFFFTLNSYMKLVSDLCFSSHLPMEGILLAQLRSCIKPFFFVVVVGFLLFVYSYICLAYPQNTVQIPYAFRYKTGVLIPKTFQKVETRLTKRI